MPTLSQKIINEFQRNEPVYVTRHIEAKYFESTKQGYFRFGTLYSYGQSEQGAAGRLSDNSEGRVQTNATLLDQSVEEGRFSGTSIKINNVTGPGKISQTLHANDFCSCFTEGEFDPKIGQEFKDNEPDEEKKPGFYVTYNLKKLKIALKRYFVLNRFEISNFILFGCKVDYGVKDKEVEVRKKFSLEIEVGLREYLEIAFRKPSVFEHEKEFRMLFLDPNRVGKLSNNAKHIEIISDKGVADSIECINFY